MKTFSNERRVIPFADCRYTCHLKCRAAVTLQCHVSAYDKSKTDGETSETCFTSEPVS